MEQNPTLIARELDEQLAGTGAEHILTHILHAYRGKVALASSLGLEDQVLTDMICRIAPSTPIFTLDTGRLFPETYSLIERTNLTYGIRIRLYFPDYREVEQMVADHGVNPFYESIEKRRLCCRIRKIDPLKRAFAGLDAWICGLRHDQSVTRAGLHTVEWDAQNGLLKINPLIDWSEQQVWDYIRAHGVPYNRLHDQGFPSIGCQPCTRAVKPDEDIRSGRWWWEDPDHKECGLHR